MGTDSHPGVFFLWVRPSPPPTPGGDILFGTNFFLEMGGIFLYIFRFLAIFGGKLVDPRDPPLKKNPDSYYPLTPFGMLHFIPIWGSVGSTRLSRTALGACFHFFFTLVFGDCNPLGIGAVANQAKCCGRFLTSFPPPSQALVIPFH